MVHRPKGTDATKKALSDGEGRLVAMDGLGYLRPMFMISGTSAALGEPGRLFTKA